MATCAPFIGDMDSLVQAASQIYLPKALSESLGMTRADPPWMLTTPPTKHKASSHNRTNPTTHCGPIHPPVTQQMTLLHRDKRRKQSHDLKPFQLSPVCGHVSEYAWMALVGQKREGCTYSSWGESWEKVVEKVWRKVGESLGKSWRILGPFNQSTILLARIAVWFYTLLVIGIYLFLDKVLLKIGSISFWLQ